MLANFKRRMSIGIMYLVRTQNFSKKQHFIPPDT